jgi:hypothetical protein
MNVSVGKLVLSLSSGLVRPAEDVIFVIGEGVEGIREPDGMGEKGGEWGVPTDFTLREGGVGASVDEWGLSM